MPLGALITEWLKKYLMTRKNNFHKHAKEYKSSPTIYLTSKYYSPKLFVERNLFICKHRALVTKHPGPARKILNATFTSGGSGRLDVL